MNYFLIIPARMQSSRLPGKPLVDIDGKSLIRRTWEQCSKAVPAEKIYVATDHPDIREHCIKQDMQVVMTSKDCLTGTDRVAEAALQLDAEFYINVQGDEPLINPQDIRDVKEAFLRHPGSVINGYAKIKEPEMWRNPSVPKVVFNEKGNLLYMSRAPIPGNKSKNFIAGWRQVCVYAFPKKALEQFSRFKRKSLLEDIEDIEILRFMEFGYEVKMIKLSDDSIAVDHPEDVDKVVQRLHEGN